MQPEHRNTLCRVTKPDHTKVGRSGSQITTMYLAELSSLNTQAYLAGLFKVCIVPVRQIT